MEEWAAKPASRPKPLALNWDVSRAWANSRIGLELMTHLLQQSTKHSWSNLDDHYDAWPGSIARQSRSN